MEEQLNGVLSHYAKSSDQLIPILQKVQGELGYLPEAAMEHIAKYIGIPESKIFAVASFYAQFRFTPMGRKHVMVCRGTACHVRGAPRILEEVERQLHIKEGETSEDLEYTLETVGCIGCCGLSPCIMVNGEVAASLTPKKVKKIFPKVKKDE